MDCAASNIAATIQPASLSSMAGQLDTRKCAGRIAALAKLMKKQPVSGTLGISHTRWATHGKVNDENAHPHFDASGKLALVHNGVIENYQALKDELIRRWRHEFSLRYRHRSARASDRETLRRLVRQHGGRARKEGPACSMLFARRFDK